MSGWVDRIWPGGAFLAWGGAWVSRHLALALGLAETGALVISLLVAVLGAACHHRPWRRAVVALGWPLALSLHSSFVPPWAWALAAVCLLLIYPRRLWRDAPLFPTPLGSLDDLARHAPLAPGAKVLDAGCGAGHGLQALARAYPQAALEGVEASYPLALWARWRCPKARIWRGDLWDAEWKGYDLVYLFQRPESMAPALVKAKAELAAHAWLVSLDFPLPDIEPVQQWAYGRHVVHVYSAKSLK